VGKKKAASTKTRTRTATFVHGKTHVDLTTVSVMPRTANVVHRVKLNDAAPAMDGSPDVFFKAHDDHDAPSQYAVASTRMARVVGMRNIVSHNAFAKVNKAEGIVSGSVPGRPLFSNIKNTEVKPRKDKTKAEVAEWVHDNQLDEREGKYYIKSGESYQWVNYRDPRIQKGLADLQLFDALTGQMDRHGGNIFVDPTTGQVTGIDDDISFGRGVAPGEIAEPSGFKYPGLPDLVDSDTAQRILDAKPEDLRAQLEAAIDDTEELTDKEIDDAVQRLVNVQGYLRILQATDQLVDTWDDTTYDRARQAGEKSYLAREATKLEGAMVKAATDPDFVILDAPPTHQPPPPPAPPLRPRLQPVISGQNPQNVPAPLAIPQNMPVLPAIPQNNPPPPPNQQPPIPLPTFVPGGVPNNPPPVNPTRAAVARQFGTHRQQQNQ
jgi:hypothetical protein